uniref:Uncharacterized protein n=1 Tax=Oryza brachyantha TaxID=4533 RepID=J3LQL3_ORYBR
SRFAGTADVIRPRVTDPTAMQRIRQNLNLSKKSGAKLASSWVTDSVLTAIKIMVCI